jgi:hypothetical protein
MTKSTKENKITITKRPRLRQLLLIGIFLFILIGTAYIVSRTYTTPVTNYTAVFDFDSGYPLLAEKQNIPLNQTANGVTAYFSSRSEATDAPAFSIQSYDTTFTELSEFSGKYLYDNKPSRDSLVIIFSHELLKIDLTFAIVEHHVNPSKII